MWVSDLASITDVVVQQYDHVLALAHTIVVSERVMHLNACLSTFC